MASQYHTCQFPGQGSNSPPEIIKLAENARDSSGVLPVGRGKAAKVKQLTNTGDSFRAFVQSSFVFCGILIIPNGVVKLKPLRSVLVLEELGIEVQLSLHNRKPKGHEYNISKPE